MATRPGTPLPAALLRCCQAFAHTADTAVTVEMRYPAWSLFSAGHPRMIGQFVDVLVTEAMTNSLRGRIAMVDHAAA